MDKRQDLGVPPAGSGLSAEPEPSCTVSALRVSVPNARETAHNWIEGYEREMIAERKAQYGARFTADQQAAIEQMHRHLHAGVDIMADAIAIEARRAETTEIGSVGDESAVRSNRPQTGG